MYVTEALKDFFKEHDVKDWMVVCADKENSYLNLVGNHELLAEAIYYQLTNDPDGDFAQLLTAVFLEYYGQFIENKTKH
jgi:hypothetical protein